MTRPEFEHAASQLASELRHLDRTDAISAACRGSGNPTMLVWLAEALELTESAQVLDIGGGLGGPCAWIEDRYGCTVVNAEPVFEAARCAHSTFAIPSMQAAGEALPFADDAFDAALALGVLSVVDSPTRLLGEARRIARDLGLIVYCSTTSDARHAGGSRFLTREELLEALGSTGWSVTAGPAAPALPPPPSWDESEHDTPSDPDEDQVASAIERDEIEAVVVTATRAQAS